MIFKISIIIILFRKQERSTMSLMKELKNSGWSQDGQIPTEVRKEYPTKNTVIIGTKTHFPADYNEVIPIRIYDEMFLLVEETHHRYKNLKDIEEYIEEAIGYFP